MKKITLAILAICTSVQLNSQSNTWDLNLNDIQPYQNPWFGTSSNHQIDFFTNNQRWMTLGTNGVLNLTGLAGTGNRFLQADLDGNLVPWVGSTMGANKILHGDGTWKLAAVLRDGNNLSTSAGTKLGLGITEPTEALDVAGSARISQKLGLGSSLNIGSAADYGLIYYTPATLSGPAILSFGSGFTTSSGGHHPDPVEPVFTIANDPLCNPLPLTADASKNPIANFMNDILINSGNNGYGSLRLGHNGYKGYIEVQGSTNPAASVSAPLLINSCNKRNVYVFGGDNFEATSNGVMSVWGKMNVQTQQQIGAKSSNNFIDNESKLYVAIEGDDAFHGVKVRRDFDNSSSGGGAYHSIKVVDSKSDYNYAFGVYRTTDNSDGTERFNILADGSTYINTTNSEALVISDANTSLVNFKVNTDGKTEIKTVNVDAFTIRNSANNSVNFKVKNTGFVYAREVIVTLNNFPDYVFSKDYKLKTLGELKTFIKTNNRLPNMPSAREVEREGASLGEIQRVTVEKVEELYLYILQLEEKISELNSKISLSEQKSKN